MCSKPLKAVSHFIMPLWVLWTLVQLVFKTRCVGDLSFKCGIRSWDAQHGVKTFTPEGEAPGFKFPPNYGSLF